MISIASWRRYIKAWRDERIDGNAKPICPTPIHDRRVPILIGGTSDKAVRRVVDWAVGLTIGGAPPEHAAALVERVQPRGGRPVGSSSRGLRPSRTSPSALTPTTTPADTCATTTDSWATTLR